MSKSQGRGVVVLGAGEEWYTNKELFEMIQGLAGEMKQTRDLIKKYNNLHKTVQEHEKYIATQLGRGKGMKSIESAILQWGGWFIAVITFVYAVLGWFRFTKG